MNKCPECNSGIKIREDLFLENPTIEFCCDCPDENGYYGGFWVTNRNPFKFEMGSYKDDILFEFYFFKDKISLRTYIKKQKIIIDNLMNGFDLKIKEPPELNKNNLEEINKAFFYFYNLYLEIKENLIFI